MIRLSRPPAPAELTEEKQKELTAAYLEDNTRRVWNKPYIREALLEASEHKCSYCERSLGSGYADGHIDHFAPKSKYPDKVVSWDNLLMACPDCNRSKRDHDTIEAPIVNPYEMNPREYFYLQHYRYCPFDRCPDGIGITTIDVLGLNDLDGNCTIRFQVVGAILDKLETASRTAAEHEAELATDIPKRNRIRQELKYILERCNPKAEYSAFVATAVRGSESYADIKAIFQRTGNWDEELDSLEREGDVCVFGTSGHS